MTSHMNPEDFDICKNVFGLLKDLPGDRQQRVLRWVAEGLGVTHVPPLVPASPHGPLIPPITQPGSPSTGSGTDIKSFISTKAPKSDNQFAAAVAYFYRFEASPAARRDFIDGEILQEATRLSGRKRLGNPRATLNNAKAAGYLDGVNPGEFSINSVGENLVAMTLPGGSDSFQRPARNKGKKATKKAVKKAPGKSKRR